MPIRPSSAADVTRLIEELSSEDALRRETAQARLSVIGDRAVTKLIALATDAASAPAARLAAVQALEAIADPRALGPALSLADRGDELGVAAIGVVGAIGRLKDARATRAFEWLAALVLDSLAADDRRLAALATLDGFPERLLKPIYDAIGRDKSARMAARATRRAADATLPLERVIDKAFPDDPAVLSAIVREEGETTKLTVLRRAIEAIRIRERAATSDRRAAWMAARGLTHQALGARGSRLALYDLRETLEQATGPLPVGFLAAAASIGDASCLTPLAAAWVQASPDDRWWRDHLAEAFRAIVARETMTRRHPVMRKILERWPSAGVLVAAARK